MGTQGLEGRKTGLSLKDCSGYLSVPGSFLDVKGNQDEDKLLGQLDCSFGKDKLLYSVFLCDANVSVGKLLMMLLGLCQVVTCVSNCDPEGQASQEGDT